MTPDFHIVAVDDLIDHEPSMACVCGPSTEVHGDKHVAFHQRLDGEKGPWTVYQVKEKKA